jgi:hypothetical protein
MLQLKMNTYPIRTEYNLQNAKLNLQSTPPKVLMETTPPDVEIRQPRGELTIDNTPYNYSIGRKNLSDFARDNAAFGRQTVLKTIARTVEEGNRLAEITKPSNVIGELAFESRFLDPGEVVWSPIEAPSIRYQANPAQIDITPGKVNFTPQPGNVQGDYQPGSVDIRVTQYPRVEISTVDVKV